MTSVIASVVCFGLAAMLNGGAKPSPAMYGVGMWFVVSLVLLIMRGEV